jgi:8-oxo-dGTP diphosphatase
VGSGGRHRGRSNHRGWWTSEERRVAALTGDHESGRGHPGRPEQRVAVYGICQDGNGRVLLVRAAPWLSVGGEWFLPGGGLDHGEDPVAGLRREFAEETGLTVGVGELRGVLSDVIDVPDGTSLHTVRIIYDVDAYRGTLRHEVAGSSDNARWVAPDEAMALPLRPYVRRALTDLV